MNAGHGFAGTVMFAILVPVTIYLALKYARNGNIASEATAATASYARIASVSQGN